MKLLFVVPMLPYPPRTGNTLIVYNYIKCLAARHSVDLISFRGQESAADVRALAGWCRHIELVDAPPLWRVRLNQTLAFVTGQPIYVWAYRSARMAEAVARALRAEPYDVAVFQKTEMAQFRPEGYTGVSILSMENPMVVNHQRLMELASSWFARLRWRDRISRLRRYEQGQVSRFQRVLLINEADARDCQRVLPGARVDWVPHGIDADAFSPGDPASRRDGMIVITGNMYHPPNVEAVDVFCREVLPLVLARVPSANVWLVGADPAPAVRKWAEHDRITVTGFVEDVRPYLHQARVSVCAVRLRIGTQTKVLEALACGTPVVTTSAGNHGIGAQSGSDLYVADDPAAMADRIAALLEGAQWQRLSENGRRFVVNNFTWQKGVAKLERIFEDVMREAAS